MSDTTVFPTHLVKGETLSFNKQQIDELDALLLRDDGRMKLHSSHFYRQFPHDRLRVWANLRARYGILTVELAWWLETQIAGRKALEVAAGCGDLGFNLHIPMTDSYQQVDNPETVAYFKALGIEPTKPGKEVVKMDAESAVILYAPKVVIASWITEKWDGHGMHGNIHGPREENILANCETYIVIGNEAIHGNKRLLALPHEKYKFPWLVSRAKDQFANVIYVWENPKRKEQP
jgi:hypothetical protein